MRNSFAAVVAACFVLGGGEALVGSESAARAQTAASSGYALVRNAFEHPNASASTDTTTFKPAVSNNLFTAQMLASLRDPQQKQAMHAYADQINRMVEQAYGEYGFEKNDLGAAFGAFLETCWEMSNGSYKTESANAQDREKTKAAVRQMQNGLLASTEYRGMSDRNKQMLYETCTFATGHLAMQWQQSASMPAKRSSVQAEARKQMQTLFGIAASVLTRKPDGTFVRSANLASGAGTKAATGATGAKPTQAKAASTPTVSTGPLPAASAHGARIFVKYVFQPTKTSFDQLILFPSGAAFTDLPTKPMAQFDEATLHASLKPYDVGVWKEAGNTIILTFPNKKRDQVTTLRKVARGWYDGTGAVEADSSYNTYFLVVPLTPGQIVGAWHSNSLTTMGFAGGGTPMVAHGSSSDRLFSANGTFFGGSKSFTSATTANMGDAFKSGGDVGAYGTNAKQGAGRWRLDGPILTMDLGGKRTVTLAFVLPHWNKSGPSELLIDGDWWQRPDKK